MSFARFFAACTASAAVIGCSVLAVHLHAAREDGSGARPLTTERFVQRPARVGGASPAALVTGQPLPVHRRTFDATRVITVKANSYRSTVATAQAWRKAPGGGWLKVGAPIPAHIGSQGLTSSPSEWKSATPVGSFTLTQAFGYRPNPGTRLHWFRSNPADWWISQAGPLYNTHQRCASNCPFNQGAPNEHLFYERPYYAYAIVIDYNTRNSRTGVRQGAGSAFFLHVTDGTPTAGCVAIPQNRLIGILKWLRPAWHPRILIDGP